MSTLEKYSVNLIVRNDKWYPEGLKNIPHSPFILYVRWEIPNGDMFWVVGSRKISPYWKIAIERLVPEISHVFPIVSGGAAGCDSFAHSESLKAQNKTVVVVGTGIDQTYPVSNEKLFDEVANGNGAIISIFRVWEPWNPYNFPVRNEIVVWLSKWILVIEASERSWSLITANLALDMWKDLFSLPWDITRSTSSWTNSLITSWAAKCVSDVSSVLEEYDINVKQSSHKSVLPNLSSQEEEIYKIISIIPIGSDDISEKLLKKPHEINTALSMLELKWLIKKDLSGVYMLK